MNQSAGDTIHSESVPWLPLAPGVRIKALRLQEDTGEYTVMIHAQKDSVLPRHSHLDESHIYIISGKGRHPQTGEYAPGSYVCERKGAVHDDLKFEEDTLLFMVSKGPAAFLAPDNSVMYMMDVGMLKHLQARGSP